MRTALSRRALRDEGFSIIEVVVAAGVLFVVLVVMAHAAVVALIDVGHSRQRQSATGLANQALEQLRALPAAVVRQGLSRTDLEASGDPRITTTTDGEDVTHYWYDGEEIVVHTPATTDPRPPLVPHVQSLTVGQTTYDVASYVTLADDGQTLRATTEVSWAEQALRKGTSGEVVSQTLMSAAVGCGDTSAHNPYPAPCAGDFAARADNGNAGIIIKPASTLDSNFEFATLDFTTYASELTIGQADVVHSRATTSGISLKLTTAADPSTSLRGLAIADASSSTGPTYEDDSATQDPAAFSTTSTNNAVNVSNGGSDTATAVSTVSAQNDCEAAGVWQTDGRPCGDVATQQMLKMRASLTLPDLVDLQPIVRAGAETTASRGFVDRTVTNSGACSLAGCVKAQAQRRINDLQLGLLPAGHNSPGWEGLVRVQGVEATSSAQAGESVGEPTAALSGTVSYWNGGGYTDVTLGAEPVDFSTSHTDTGVYSVTMSGSFTAGGTAPEDPAACGLSCRRTEASATARILKGSLRYTVKDGSSTVADLLISVDLGAVQATATYERPLHVF